LQAANAYFDVQNLRIMNQLKLLFAALQEFEKRSYDPKDFAEVMSIHTGIQQDVQEYVFSII